MNIAMYHKRNAFVHEPLHIWEWHKSLRL